MSVQKPSKKTKGCGCSMPMSLLLVMGGAYGWFIHLGHPLPKIEALESLWNEGQAWINPIFGIALKDEPASPSQPAINQEQSKTASAIEAASTPVTSSPKSPPTSTPRTSPIHTPAPASPPIATPPKAQKIKSPWKKKAVRGIYLSRYQITNNASEVTIRERVRYYKAQGFNTIIHGVWGNGCTMYRSAVMQQTLGFASCPNLFREQWLDWMIDEAHQQGMEIHAYFEKGIKLDKNSPIYDRAVSQKWLVPGVDKTYQHIDHYVLDVQVPEVSRFFQTIATEFVQRYPTIDAVQWDDYVGYHAELGGTEDRSSAAQRTQALTQFMQGMIKGVKTANPNVSFDLCHHNPYWSKRYFSADWQNWDIDRAFIQVYNDGNFEDDLGYVHQHDGAAITDQQLHRLKPLIADSKVKGILVFPNSGQPETTEKRVKEKIGN